MRDLTTFAAPQLNLVIARTVPGAGCSKLMRLIDSCITQLTAQGPSRTCNESKEEEEELMRHCLSSCAGIRVWDLWFMVSGVWFLVSGVWFMVYGLWFRV